jgi:hypothetical protein
MATACVIQGDVVCTASLTQPAHAISYAPFALLGIAI